jgi:Protein of unknown function (DUF2510)
MQEFESISASSYDPSALATKLTAKAADGWSVVAIVPTGGDVTAFVSREKSGADDSSKPADTSEPAKAKVEDEASSLVLPAKSEAAAESDTEPKPESKPDPKPEPVSEPSGWAIAPEPATPSAEPSSPQPAVTVQPGSSYQPGGAPSFEPTAAAVPAAASPAAASPAAATPAPAAATPDPAPAPAVPAGWYADPAGRFELRYWDGSTWTEHVSRSGQQFTDPPVA